MPPISFALSAWEWREGWSSASSTLPPVLCNGHVTEDQMAQGLSDNASTSSSERTLILLSTNNFTSATTLPPDLVFNEDSVASIIAYCSLLAVSAVGNVSVIAALVRLRHRKSRVDFMLTHLAVADLVVTFVMIPMEIGWRVTIQWIAGNAACKIFLFVRAFGLYLSSMVMVCVSLDRYFAVVHPLRVSDARNRAKTMLCIAWAVALLCSLPQSIIFHVSRHPQYPNFKQCVSFGSFQTHVGEMLYNVFCVVVMYFFPLFVICYAYTRILLKLCKRRTQPRDANVNEDESSTRSTMVDGCRSASTSAPRFHLRRNDMSNIERARSRTLRMTVNIVLVFICCWTPYVVMTLWYTFHRESAEMVNSRVQDMLFITAVSNSCMNPLVYGNYVFNLKKIFSRFASKLCKNRWFPKKCRCCCCMCVCGKPESVHESVVMEIVPATVRPPRRQFHGLHQSSHPPEDSQKSLSSMSRMMGPKRSRDYQGKLGNKGRLPRGVSPDESRLMGNRRKWPLTPEHSSAPAEMPNERRRRRAEWVDDSSAEWYELSALSDPASHGDSASERNGGWRKTNPNRDIWMKMNAPKNEMNATSLLSNENRVITTEAILETAFRRAMEEEDEEII